MESGGKCSHHANTLYDSSSHFSIQHFDQPAYSGYKERAKAFQLHGKRKSTPESTTEFHPVTKQQITEARIASSMQRLSLYNEIAAQAPVPNRTSDEGFCEDGVNFDDDGFNFDEDLDLVDDNNRENIPQFTFAPGIRDSLKKASDDILPKEILKSMYGEVLQANLNQACLAVVPYRPPSEIILKFNKDEEVTTTKNTSSLSTAMKDLIPKVATENDDEMFAEWESYEEMDE